VIKRYNACKIDYDTLITKIALMRRKKKKKKEKKIKRKGIPSLSFSSLSEYLHHI
jgi:hypothetical protein